MKGLVVGVNPIFVSDLVHIPPMVRCHKWFQVFGKIGGTSGWTRPQFMGWWSQILWKDELITGKVVY